MHAVMVTVRMAPARADEARKTLDDYIVPSVKQHPGLVKGTWMAADELGVSVVTYDSQENAEKAAGGVSAGPDDPISIESVQVYEVHAEA